MSGSERPERQITPRSIFIDFVGNPQVAGIIADTGNIQSAALLRRAAASIDSLNKAQRISLALNLGRQSETWEPSMRAAAAMVLGRITLPEASANERDVLQSANLSVDDQTGAIRLVTPIAEPVAPPATPIEIEPQVVEQIVALYSEKTPNEIADEVGLPADDVKNVIRKARKYKTIRPEKSVRIRKSIEKRRQAIIAGAAANKTIQEIADELDVRAKTLYGDAAALRQQGVDLSGIRDARALPDQTQFDQSVLELARQGLTRDEIAEQLIENVSRVRHAVVRLIQSGDLAPERPGPKIGAKEESPQSNGADDITSKYFDNSLTVEDDSSGNKEIFIKYGLEEDGSPASVPPKQVYPDIEE